MGDLLARLRHDPQFAGGNELHTLTCLDRGALDVRQGGVFWPRFAHGDQRSRLREAVRLGDGPAEGAFDRPNRRGGGRSAGGQHAHACRRVESYLFRSMCEIDQDRRGSAEGGDTFVSDQREDLSRVDLAEADVCRADSGDDPGKGPPIGMEHRQSPEVAIVAGHREVQHGADGVHPRVTVGDHHALWARGGAAGVVDTHQIVLVDRRSDWCWCRFPNQRLVVPPSGARLFQRHEVLHRIHLVADIVDEVEVRPGSADDRRPAVGDQIADLARR